ncbi:SRPBCC family protein [Streptomyces sp. MS1.AVA.1]|uniref:SRPBCC family protein n=1 Tax=Streptomyces machairae TaxID=3134109 RepID=A0ABU8UI02_9ACTN
MAHLLREVGLDFVGTAPVRHVFAREITAPPEAVHHALAEDVSGWTEWFSAVTLARPLDDGARREIRLKGGTRFEETILATKSPELYAYRIDITNAPGARAMVEEWRLARRGRARGCSGRSRWTARRRSVLPSASRGPVSAGRSGTR